MNFGGLESQDSGYTESDIVILPVPFDGTSTWIKGADKGPMAIFEASANMELYDIETGTMVYKRGIHTTPAIDASLSEEMVKRVEDSILKVLDDQKFPVIVGGEHSVSIGAFKAFGKRYKNLTILHLDAHSDLRQAYEGSPLNHACVMARAREITDITQVGIRSMCEIEKPYMDINRVFFAREIRDSDQWIPKILGTLSENVYITLDLDVFDPGIMPSTGTPEPDGLHYHQVLQLLSAVTHSRNVVGFDVVELCPIPGNAAPDFMTAKLIYQFLSQIFKNG